MPKQLLLALADPTVAEQAIVALFSQAGFEVGQAGDTKQLRRILAAEERPDALLVDVDFDPAIFTLLEELNAAHPTLPILLLAKRPSPQLLQMAVRTGVMDVLSLPLEPQTALNAANRATERKQQWDSWFRRETGRITRPLNRRISEMEAILRQVNDGVMVLDRQDQVLMVNQALRHTFGLGDEEFAGLAPTEVLKVPGFAEALQDENPESGRHEIESGAGRVFHVRVARVPDVGTVVSLHDISYLKELDKLKGDFVNTVSHDLRSPLTAILGYVELIERAGRVNPQQSEFIDRVKSSVHTTTALIDDLLKLGRVEVGELDERTPVNFKLLVVNVITGMQPKVQEKGQTLQLANNGNLHPVIGSRTQLNQVVDNLIGNAVKYTQPGGKIRVSLREKGKQMILQVVDNGPGIPLEEQSHIFDKFYRASNVEDSTPGTGLGLAIVKSVVDNHGGRIWVDSKPGEGSVFTVVLPVIEE